ncbi:hypothetical protein L915_17640, partial [Phytophthora nicotianae]
SIGAGQSVCNLVDWMESAELQSVCDTLQMHFSAAWTEELEIK